MPQCTGAWAKIKGAWASSTRTEIAAIDLAMTIPRATHIATDSKAAAEKLHQLLNVAEEWNNTRGIEWWPRAKPYRKPWGCQKD